MVPADYAQYPGVASFTQPDTIKNTFSVGLEEKWSPCFQTYVRYKWIGTKYPFFGFTPAVETANAAEASVNTALPTLENRVEIGGTWTACDCLMLNATVYLEAASNNGPYANWDSNSFPYMLSAWWSATPQLSFNAGFAQMDSWINQDIWQSSLAAAHAAGGLDPGNVQQPLGRGQPGRPLRLDPEVLDLCHVRVHLRHQRNEHSRGDAYGGDSV